MVISSTNERVFDTILDTNKIYVSMKTKFQPRDYKNGEGKSPIYLIITGNYQRERIKLDINVDTIHWDRAKQRLKPLSREYQDINLIIDNIQTKLTNIQTAYRLAERVLTPEGLKNELIRGMPRVQFVAFCHMSLSSDKSMMKPGSYKRYLSIIKKVEEYQPDVTFLDIDERWVEKYIRYLTEKGNQKTTINSNLSGIKRFLTKAIKEGIRLKINIDEIKIGSTKGNRTALMPAELKRCLAYFNSDFIPDNYRIILGYFLFSCMTGIRISDVKRLKRRDFMDNQVSFISQKTNKQQSIRINDTLKAILSKEPQLFEIYFADQHINDELKKIMKNIGISKKVTFHVARHTFATSYLRAGGTVEKLRLILGHSNISQTMIYVDIVNEEANNDIMLLDDLLSSNL